MVPPPPLGWHSTNAFARFLLGHSEWHSARQKRLNADASPVKRSVQDSTASPSGPSAAYHAANKLARSSAHGMWRQSATGQNRGKREEPEWYIKKFMDRTADHRVVAALAVALRTYEIR